MLRPPRKDGQRPVHLRRTSHRLPTFRAIPALALSEKHWNEAGTPEKFNWVRKTHPAAERYNEVLRKLLRQVEQPDDNPAWNAQQLWAALVGEADKKNFLASPREDVERRALAGHPRTAEKFESIHSKRQRFRCSAMPKRPASKPRQPSA